MKNTVAVAAGDRVVLSPHLGDLGGAATRTVFRRTVDMLAELHGADFTAVACDRHPDYASTRYAEELGLPRVAVQHHLAHVLACLLEHRHAADDVLGVAWDGTGYGEDGTIWGGEFTLLSRRSASGSPACGRSGSREGKRRSATAGAPRSAWPTPPARRISRSSPSAWGSARRPRPCARCWRTA